MLLQYQAAAFQHWLRVAAGLHQTDAFGWQPLKVREATIVTHQVGTTFGVHLKCSPSPRSIHRGRGGRG